MRQDDRGRRRALVHINKRVRVQKRQAEMIERVVMGEELAHHARSLASGGRPKTM